MAFNLQTFRTRTLTAIIFVVVMLAGLLWNQWSFLLLFSIIHFGCWWEYLALTEKIHRIIFHPYVKLGFMLMGFGIMLWFCDASFQFGTYRISENLPVPFCAAGFVMLLLGIFQKLPVTLSSFAMAGLGLVYISLSLGMMIDLYREILVPFYDTTLILKGFHIPLAIIAAIWINDTMAYLVGSFIGKTPLSFISPKKTWEGTIGGIVLSVVITSMFAWLIYENMPMTIFISILAAIASIAGTFGDLLQSKLKRMAGVKDSGSIMPGHGGFLDRFDSFLLAVFFVWVYVTLVKP